MVRYTNFALAIALVLPLAGCPSDDGNVDTATDDVGTDATTGGGDNFCAHQCSVDADCRISGIDVGLTCQDSFCESAGCTSDLECVAMLSSWTTPCTSGGGECDGTGQICIASGDGGLCATPPSDFLMCELVPGFGELEVPDIDGNTVTVCGTDNPQCADDGNCYAGCQDNADCPSTAFPICDTGTGSCRCGSNLDCGTIGLPQVSVCNDGECGCGEDQHCVDGDAGDVCTGTGYCGCSGDAVCASVPNIFDGGMIACVP